MIDCKLGFCINRCPHTAMSGLKITNKITNLDGPGPPEVQPTSSRRATPSWHLPPRPPRRSAGARGRVSGTLSPCGARRRARRRAPPAAAPARRRRRRPRPRCAAAASSTRQRRPLGRGRHRGGDRGVARAGRARGRARRGGPRQEDAEGGRRGRGGGEPVREKAVPGRRGANYLKTT